MRMLNRAGSVRWNARSGGGYPRFPQPVSDLLVHLGYRMDLEVMREPVGGWLHDLLPAWRFVSPWQGKGEHQRRVTAPEILAGHPDPCKAASSPKRNLALRDPDAHRADGLN